MGSTTAGRSIQFFATAESPLLDDDGMMTPPDLDPAVHAALDLTPLAAGSTVRVLFKGDEPDGLSLVWARFEPGYRLPRHSHSADCLYFVVSGEARMGNRVLGAGDGFFVRADQPYAYEAGPEGVVVLEFRSATSIDMKIFDQTVERWRPIVQAAVDNQERWLAAAP